MGLIPWRARTACQRPAPSLMFIFTNNSAVKQPTGSAIKSPTWKGASRLIMAAEKADHLQVQIAFSIGKLRGSRFPKVSHRISPKEDPLPEGKHRIGQFVPSSASLRSQQALSRAQYPAGSDWHRAQVIELRPRMEKKADWTPAPAISTAIPRPSIHSTRSSKKSNRSAPHIRCCPRLGSATKSRTTP